MPRRRSSRARAAPRRRAGSRGSRAPPARPRRRRRGRCAPRRSSPRPAPAGSRRRRWPAPISHSRHSSQPAASPLRVSPEAPKTKRGPQRGSPPSASTSSRAYCSSSAASPRAALRQRPAQQRARPRVAAGDLAQRLRHLLGPVAEGAVQRPGDAGRQQRGEDAAAGDGADGADLRQQPELVEPGQGAEVEERRAVPVAGQPERPFAAVGFASPRGRRGVRGSPVRPGRGGFPGCRDMKEIGHLIKAFAATN